MNEQKGKEKVSMISFESRLRTYIAEKVKQNIEILEEKRIKEYHERLNKMMQADIEKSFTSIEFKRNLDKENA